MREDMRCEECKNTTKPDEFTCNCLCLNCGPCDENGCEYGKKVQNICGTPEAKKED